jgi:TonB family protein
MGGSVNAVNAFIIFLRKNVVMQMRYVAVLALIVSFCFGPARSANGQQSSAVSTRKVLHKAEPAYPEIAKKMNLGGTVKVVAVVAADGAVTKVEPVGGSPVLLQAAETAVAQWKFAPGAESKEIVELRFTP